MTRIRYVPTIGALALVGAVALAACGAPTPEDVITGGSHAQDGGWCAVLTDAEVGSLVGEDQADRVRQVGTMEPSSAPSQECDVVWADGENYTEVATARTVLAREPYGGDTPFRLMLPVLGEDGQLLEDGTTTQLADGVYQQGSTVYAWTVLEPEEAGGAPHVAEMSLILEEDLPGSLAPDELAEIGQRMQGMTPEMVEWPGQARPLEPEDLATLLDGAEAAGVIGPWRGHELGQG